MKKTKMYDATSVQPQDCRFIAIWQNDNGVWCHEFKSEGAKLFTYLEDIDQWDLCEYNDVVDQLSIINEESLVFITVEED